MAVAVTVTLLLPAKRTAGGETRQAPEESGTQDLGDPQT